VLAAQQRDCALDDPAVDLLDDVEALGDREERRRRHQLVVLGSQPQQQLERGRRVARAQRDDRLGMKFEVAFREAVADPLQPRQA
jgi:hypothetical protein